MSGRFDAKVILITGAGSGLGRCCALQWAAEGGSIVVTDINEDRAHAVAAEIKGSGGQAEALRVDVGVEAEVADAVDRTVARFGRLDIMFANAGRSVKGGTQLEDTTEEQWDFVNDTVFKGVFFSGKHACRVMKAQGGGNIVVTTSAAALNAYPVGFGAYAAGKTGAYGLVKIMAVQWGRYGIRVNGLAPTHGMSVNFAWSQDAPVTGRSYEEYAQEQSGEPYTPQSFVGPLKVGRPPSLRDNAAVASFLASDDSAYMSGIIIPSCDGGSFALTSIPFPDDWNMEKMVGSELDARPASEAG